MRMKFVVALAVACLVLSQVNAQQYHPAEEIVPGTGIFSAGDYTFPGRVYWNYDDGTNAAFLDADASAAGDAYIVYMNPANEFRIYTRNAADTENWVRMGISSGVDTATVNLMNSNLGIGTNDPTGWKTRIISGGFSNLRIGNTLAGGAEWGFGLGDDGLGMAGDLSIGYKGASGGGIGGGDHYNVMTLQTDGNVGIGTTGPGQRLSVVQNVNHNPPGLGNSGGIFGIFKDDGFAGGNYGLMAGVQADGRVWMQAQRRDGTATAYDLLLQPSGGNVGIGTSPNTILDIAGAFSVRGMAAPAVSPAGQGRIYFDSTANKFKVSENAGAYVDLVGVGGAPGGSDGQVQYNNGGTFGGASDLYYDDTNNRVGIGTPGPTTKLYIEGTSDQNARITVKATDIDGNAGIRFENDAHQWLLQLNGWDNDKFVIWNVPASTARLTVQKNGNVGIGTTSPGSNLDINEATSGNAVMRLSGFGGPGDAVIELLNQNFASTEGHRILYDNDVGDTYFDNIWAGGVDSNPAIRFRTKTAGTPVNAMTITHAGNVGIGTPGPSAKLQVRADGGGDPDVQGLYVYNPDNAVGEDSIVGIRVAGSSAGDPFISWDIAGEYGWSMGIDNDDANKLKIGRSWTDPASNTVLTLDTDGNVGIGTPSPDNAKVHILNPSAAIDTLKIEANPSTGILAVGIRTSASGASNAYGISSSATGPGNNYAVRASASGGAANYGIYSVADTNYFSGNLTVGGDIIANTPRAPLFFPIAMDKDYDWGGFTCISSSKIFRTLYFDPAQFGHTKARFWADIAIEGPMPDIYDIPTAYANLYRDGTYVTGVTSSYMNEGSKRTQNRVYSSEFTLTTGVAEYTIYYRGCESYHDHTITINIRAAGIILYE